jgi:hypothetical protein
MFDISAPKTQNFIPFNISYVHYRTLEYVDRVTLYHFHIQITKVSTCKTCFKPKSP